MSGEMVAWCCCWWQHGGCEGGAAAAVTVDGGDGDDRDGVAVTCGGVKAAGDDGVEAKVVVGGVRCGSRRRVGSAGGACEGDRVDRNNWSLWSSPEKNPPKSFRRLRVVSGGVGARPEKIEWERENKYMFCVYNIKD
ncbi:hypothetical protein Tco_0695328 [Tanacetum coccineum]